MRGKILDYNLQESSGIISAENGERYSFSNRDWKSSTISPSKELEVDFTVEETKALEVYVIQSKTVIQTQDTSGAAIVSMIFGILGFLSSWWLLSIPSIIAIVSGHIARLNIKRSQGKLQGDGFAITGLILGYLIVFTYLLMLIVGAVFLSALSGY